MPPPTPSESAAIRTRTAWSLLAAIVVFAAMIVPFSLGMVYTADDLGAFHLPYRAHYSAALAEGQAFDWMPGLFGGFYFTGEGQAGAYHPLHWLLYRALPLSAAFDLECLLSYPLLLGGMFLLLRRWLPSDAALFGGLAFTFCGFNLLHFIHPNAVAVVAHLPLLLWAIDVVLREPKGRVTRWAELTLALATASQLLLGYPQYVWFSLLAEIGYAAFLCGIGYSPPATRKPKLFRLAWFAFLGLLIGGVQLLPTADALAHSARQSADSAFTASGSLHPLNLLQLVAPYLFATRVVGQNTHELGLYAGAVPLVLTTWLLLNRRRWGALRPLILATVALAVIGLILALGSFGYVYQLQTYLPGVGKFRFPCRAVVLVNLALAVLAAIGFERLIATRGEAQNSRGLWALVGASIVTVLVGSLVWRDYLAAWPLVAVGPLLIGTTVWLVIRTTDGSHRALVALIVLCAADLGTYGLSYAVWPQTMPLAQFAGPHLGSERAALDLADFKYHGPRQGNRILLGGLKRIDGYAGLMPERQLDYHELAALQAAGVRSVLRTEANQQIAGLERCDAQWLTVPKEQPWVRLTQQAVVSDEPARDIGRIPLATMALVAAPLEKPLGEADTPGTVTVTASAPGQLEFQVETPTRQLLVVAESFHSGWRAQVDGVPQPVVRANGDFLGCAVDSGRHLVTFEFRPASLAYGRWLSVCGLGLLGLSLWVGRPRKPHYRHHQTYEPPAMTCEIIARRPPLSETTVSFVLPVYNEAEVLPTLLERVQAAVADCGVRCEVLFVNDGSSDHSAAVLDQLAAKYRHVRVLHLSRNFGHQAAVQAGLAHAGGDCVLLMDSDLQDAPEALPRFLEQWQAGYDVVYAIRTDRKESQPKRFLFSAFYRVLGAIATTRIPPDAGNFGLIDARVLREIVALAEHDRYLPGLRSWVGYRQTGIEVKRSARYDDRPRVSLRGLWHLAKTAVFSFSSFPLTVFYLIGYAALAVFIGLAGFSLFCKLFTNLAIPGWTSHILSASFFGALNALGISMLGEYVIRIYDQVRNRPLFLVDRKVNFEATRSEEATSKKTTKTRRRVK